MEIKANDANGCYPLRSMKRIGSLKNNYLSLHVNIRIRHRNQSLEQYYKNLEFINSMMHNGRGGGRLCKFVSTSYSILLSREINLKAQSQYNVRAHERLPEKS